MANIGIWECDLATETLIWTDTVYDLFDLPRGTAIHRNDIVGRYDATSRVEMERLRSEAIRTGTGFALDVLIHTARGQNKWIRLTADVEQEDGISVRIFGTKQDISAERAAQEKVQSLQTELIHLSRVSAMETMASTLAHEVNQPLTAASNYLSVALRMAASGTGTPELSRCLDAALKSTLRAGETIRLVRDMTGKSHFRKAHFEMEKVVQEAADLATAGATNLSITYDIAPESPVTADRIQIQQVLINLIQNAYEAASRRACHIIIRSSKGKTHLEICVSDNGPGIPREILSNIFESFVTTKPDGLGIGLSISRTIIEAHGGRIRAANQPGGGASFCFTLPLMGADTSFRPN